MPRTCIRRVCYTAISNLRNPQRIDASFPNIETTTPAVMRDTKGCQKNSKINDSARVRTGDRLCVRQK
ncbi:hypothetical protein KCU71_g165, partial [Aureobasidium melanogenum]